MERNLPRALCESRAKWEFIHDIAEECKDHFHYEMSLKTLNDLLASVSNICGFCKEANGFPDGFMWSLKCDICFLAQHLGHTCLSMIPCDTAEDDCALDEEFEKLVKLSNFMLVIFDEIEKENK